MQALIEQIQKLVEDILHHFNLVGRIYLQFQFLFRFLIYNLLLTDIFNSDDLICDTNQVGCQRTCINRFTPITWKKLWEFELWGIIFFVVLFTLLKQANDEIYSFVENKKGVTSDLLRSSLNVKTKTKNFIDSDQNPTNVEYKYTKLLSIGYIFILIMRTLFHLTFLHFGYQLAMHQTNKLRAEAFFLPESYSTTVKISSKFLAVFSFTFEHFLFLSNSST